ncbi:MAG TPA: hypothetical protein VLI72_03665 [Methylibium sp.]|nr:hypothetical protein [Methylibium sp.]
MTHPLSADGDGVRWYSRDHEAVQLAAGLRSARVTLLSGPARSGKTTLLHQGLLPLLRRRTVDHGPLPAAALPPGVLPIPDRRRRATAPWAATPEVAMVFDRWDGEPLAALLGHVQAELGLRRVVDGLDDGALGDSLALWGRQLGARLLLILDGFDAVLGAPAGDGGCERLSAALLQAIGMPSLPANFLFAFRDTAEPGLMRWCRRWPGIERQHVRLPPPQGGGLLSSFAAARTVAR